MFEISNSFIWSHLKHFNSQIQKYLQIAGIAE